jgi:hypothetical protein
LLVLVPNERLSIDDVLRHGYFAPLFADFTSAPLFPYRSFYPSKEGSLTRNRPLLDRKSIKNRKLLLDWALSIVDE